MSQMAAQRSGTLRSQVVLGDPRQKVYETSYSSHYAVTGAAAAIRSPLRNKDGLGAGVPLRELYSSAYSRVGE